MKHQTWIRKERSSDLKCAVWVLYKVGDAEMSFIIREDGTLQEREGWCYGFMEDTEPEAATRGIVRVR